MEKSAKITYYRCFISAYQCVLHKTIQEMIHGSIKTGACVAIVTLLMYIQL